MRFFLRPQAFFDLGDSLQVFLFALAEPINFPGELGFFVRQFFDSGSCELMSFFMLGDPLSLLRGGFAEGSQLLVEFLFLGS